MNRTILLLALLLALIAPPAFAAAWSNTCSFTGGDTSGTIGTPSQGVTVTASTIIGPNPPTQVQAVGDSSTLCYRFNLADGVHNAGPFVVQAPNAQILFDASLDGTAPTTARVIPHVCAAGLYTPATPNLSCPSMGGANGQPSLTGLEGTESVQNAAKWVGPGLYYLEISAACAAADTCQVSIRGAR